ncbi:MAG: type VI secretion system-associated FHA domain protein TagH [Blastopirellula sp.]|nr:MAG: type VI secretion system-associated FHA domain protein TagH [Blastopirellula sp.]
MPSTITENVYVMYQKQIHLLFLLVHYLKITKKTLIFFYNVIIRYIMCAYLCTLIYCEMDFMKLIFKIINNPSCGTPSEKCKVFDSNFSTIGRSSSSDWVLPDPDRFISSKHAEINLRDNQFFLKDVSSNGTINALTDEPIGNNQELLISNGQTFLVGEYLIQAEIEGAADNGLQPSTQSIASENANWDNQMDDFWGNSSDPLDLLAPNKAPAAVSTASEAMPSLANSLERTPAFKQAMSFSNKVEAEPEIPAAPEPMQSSGIPENWDNTSFSFPEPEAQVAPPAQEPVANTQALSAIEDIPDDDDFFSGLAGDSFFDEELPQTPVATPSPVEEPPQSATSPAPQEESPKEELPPVASPNKFERPASTRPRKRQQPERQPLEQHSLEQQPLEQEKFASTTAATNDNLLEKAKLSLEQQGFDKELLTEEVAAQWLSLMPTIMQSTIELLQARAAIKNEFRVSKTLLTTSENNPLKFSTNAEDAINSLFHQNRPGFLTSDLAFQQAFRDINQHQSALLHGVRVAMMDLLKQFDAEVLEENFTRSNKSSGLLGKLNSTKSSQAKLWQQYKELYKSEYKVDSDDSFQRIFGETFAQAYDEFSTND